MTSLSFALPQEPAIVYITVARLEPTKEGSNSPVVLAPPTIPSPTHVPPEVAAVRVIISVDSAQISCTGLMVASGCPSTISIVISSVAVLPHRSVTVTV